MTNNELQNYMLQQILDSNYHNGVYNLRVDGVSIDRQDNKYVKIIQKKDKQGIDIFVKANTKKQTIYIPVLILSGGINDLVYNDFHIESNCEVVIVAGCGIHNHTDHNSEHNGIHTFYIDKNSKVTYIEKHFGHGENIGKKNLSPVTSVYLGENSTMNMSSIQMEGVDYAVRLTKAELQKKSTFVVKEKILTQHYQFADSIFDVVLQGEDASTKIQSRAVAKDNSKQEFHSNVVGQCKSFGHIECDAIITDKANIIAIPQIQALDTDARLIHEASIGKIAGEQLNKLLTLGLDEKQAEDFIIKGFLS